MTNRTNDTLALTTDEAIRSDCSRRRFLGSVATLAGAATAGVGMGGLLGGATPAEAEIGPEIGDDRLALAFAKRGDAADRMLAVGAPDHPDNGDETLYGNKIGSFSKGLPHNALGEVNLTAYNALIAALSSGDPADFEAIPLGGARKLVNPQSGLAFDTEGNDPHQFVQPAAPALASAETAGESVELYWMALLRDLPFNDYDLSNNLVWNACNELSSLSDFRGPKEGGEVTPQTLFRDVLPGCTEGPYISQFMLLGTPFGTEYVERRQRTVVPGSDFATRFSDWLAVQNGNVPGRERFDNNRYYIRNGRDLAAWVHIDVLFQAYFNACLILGTPPDPDNRPTGGGIGCPVNPGNPYRNSATQDGFGTWGPPGFKALLCEAASRALKAVWFQKWYVHRRLRPEEYGGLVHLTKTGQASYPVGSEILDSDAIRRTRNRFGTYLHPMAFPEGSPIHPSYGAGHATVAGASVTILKALFDEHFEITHPVRVRRNGQQIEPYHGAPLTVGGELNKIASNVGTGRNIAGVHWRSDALESFRLGEAVAIALLEDTKANFNEVGSFIFTKFDGTPIVI